MMTRLMRVLTIVLFIAAAGCYGGVTFYTESRTDQKRPEIQMAEEEISVSIGAGTEELLSGVTASDEKDGDVTDSLVIESFGNFVERGMRQITIAAFDSDHNVAKTVRTIRYSDYISPRITLKGPLRVAFNSLDSLIHQVSVQDCLDGDITENLQIIPAEGVTVTAAPGEYAMKMTAVNSAGDITEIPVTVELYDYSVESMRPELLLSEYLVYVPVGQKLDPYTYLKGMRIRGQEYNWDAAKEEELPPIEKKQVAVENPVDVNTPGTYEIRYAADDAEGNQSSVRLVVVVEE